MRWRSTRRSCWIRENGRQSSRICGYRSKPFSASLTYLKRTSRRCRVWVRSSEKCSNSWMRSDVSEYIGYALQDKILMDLISSHCQGIIRTPICRRLQIKGREGEAEARHACRAGYDHAHHHAHAPARSRPPRIQYVARRSWSSIICGYRWSERSDKRATRSHRATTQEPRAVLASRHQAAKGRAAVRSSRYWQDSSCKSCGQLIGDQLPQRYAVSNPNVILSANISQSSRPPSSTSTSENPPA